MSFEVIEELQGKTLTEIERDGNEEIRFYTTEGKVVRMYHSQECCEDVEIEDLTGDLDDLVGHPLTRAEVRSNSQETFSGDQEWTFYQLDTVKGSVTIRWYGTSNGYYSTSVSISEYDA